MRRLNHRAGLLLCTALTMLVACSRQPPNVETIEESETPQISSIIQISDPATADQLLSGFHDVEQNAWRWTEGHFSVTLRAPAEAASKGATLELKFVLPDVVFSKVGPVTLRATVDGVALDPETYSTSGEQTYSRDVPSPALGDEAATVNFALDKYLKSGQVESRELGVIVTSVALLAK